jgi:hypothetical protein
MQVDHGLLFFRVRVFTFKCGVSKIGMTRNRLTLAAPETSPFLSTASTLLSDGRQPVHKQVAGARAEPI